MKQLSSQEIKVNKTPNINKLASVGEMGFFGNVWVRSHYLHKKGYTNDGGHTHNFDHVTLLATGSVLVEVDGYEPKEFIAPTFITIEKNHHHKFTALEDGVVYYCVFAMRDEDGQVIVDEENMPNYSAAAFN
jgi:quercetin dioxygenase-like cupin family protein